MAKSGAWLIKPLDDIAGREFFALVDPYGAEVLRHWYVPFLRRCAGRLNSRAKLNAELVRGICRTEASTPVEFSPAYRDDFDNPEAVSAAE